YPTCADLVAALRAAGEEAARIGSQAPVPTTLAEDPAVTPPEALEQERVERPAAPAPRPAQAERPAPSAKPMPAAKPVPPGRPAPSERPAQPEKILEQTNPSVLEVVRQAPPKHTGEGILFPALVIGLGQKGLQVLQTLRETLTDKFGSLQSLPHLRMLFIDTDPDTISAATHGSGSGALFVSETLPIRLNRPSHYLRLIGGKTVIDGWFNSKLIYRIPRNPATTGMRCLGRLALVDHFRPIMSKLRSELEACTNPEALAASERQTQLGLRCNY